MNKISKMTPNITDIGTMLVTAKEESNEVTWPFECNIKRPKPPRNRKQNWTEPTFSSATLTVFLQYHMEVL